MGIIELDSAIIRCGKIVKYNSSSPFVDDALYMMGNAFLLKGEYQMAIRKFQEIVQFYPGSSFHAMALLKTGVAYTLKGEYENALSYFIKAYMTGDRHVMPEALYNEIKVYVLSGEHSIAVSKISEFKDKYPRSSFYLPVLLEESEIYFKNEDWTQLFLLQQQIHEVLDEKNFPLYYRTNLRFAQALRHLDRTDEAIEVLQSLRSRMTTGSNDAEVAIEIAQCLREKGEYQQAISMYDEIVKTYARTREAAKALYLSAEIYEEDLFDLAKAKELYDQARLSNPDDLTASLSMRRALSLERIFVYEAQAETMTGEGKDKIEFFLAELYNFELNNSEIGEQKFLGIIVNYPESEYYPKALLMYANILREKGDYSKSDSIYRSVIEFFPSTDYSQYAFGKLGYADTSGTEE
ncbi:tetratricopeptide repeat protein [candidate division WOR-3 bacterium]|nr:tetratricopeptide repeat protein [candidate division WOR-3 bacterium]